MASGTIVGTKIDGFGVEIDWVATPNAATNSSTVVSKIYITYININMGSRTVTSTINGVSSTFTSASVKDYPNTRVRRLMCTHTTTVDHTSNGTKSVTISASVPFRLTSNNYGYIDTLNASQEVVFDTIARASTFTLSTTTPNTGSAFVATITKADSTFRHRIQFIINGVEKDTTGYFTSSTYSCVINHSWIPTALSAPGIVRLYTYPSTGDTHIGYTDMPITANVDPGIKPSVSLTSTLVSGGLNGYYIQGKSKAKLTATAAAGEGSYITSYVFTGPNVDGSTTNNYFSIISSATTYNLTTNILKEENVKTYQVTVYDARGRYNTASVDIMIYPHVEPEILSVSVQRCNSDNVLAKDGKYVRYTINSKFSPIVIGTTINNPRTVKVSFSDNGGTSYQNEKTIRLADNTDTLLTGIYGDGLIDTSKSYKFKVVIEETSVYKGSNTKYVDLGSIERTINVAKYGNGVAIGGFSSVTTKEASGLFESAWNAKFSKNVTVAGAETVGGNLTVTGSTTSGSIVSNGNTKTATLTATGAATAASLSTTGNVTVGGSLSVEGSAVEDFVVDQGESDMWTYRKWNSGIAECWGITSFAAPTSMKSLGSMFYNGVQLPSLPFTFAKVRSVVGNVYAPDNGLYWFNPFSVNGNLINAWIIGADSTTRTTYVYVTVYGTWK